MTTTADVSPRTGLTRADWEATADRLLLALRPHATPRHALIHPPGPASRSGRWSDGVEGFARTFLLAAFRVAGADGADPHGYLDWYAEGIAAGADTSSPERWPSLLERTQERVEAASIVLGLHETRPWLWDKLDSTTQEHVVAWLSDFIGTSGYDNNWVWFQNVAEAFLRTVGGPWSAEDIERNLALHESWYVGDGWYSDGGGERRQSFDYYGAWAMHFYPLWYERILGQAPSETYRDRLRQYLEDAQYLVGADGAPLFQGRSLTYRFAMLAPFWAGAVFDATPLPPGRTRRLASGVLQYFVDHGAIDDTGLVSIGWHGAFPAVRQLYTGPGSPYWASKGFAGLLLPPDHPVWSATEEPLPVEDGDVVRSLSRPGWVVSATSADGIVRIANHGSDHLRDRFSTLDDPFYLRHGYATHAAPELSLASLRDPVDSQIALIDSDGHASHRGRIERVWQSENVAVSRCRALWVADESEGSAGDAAVWPAMRVGPWLTTASVLRGAVEVRIARIDGWDEPVAGTPYSTRTAPPLREDPDAHWPADTGPWRIRIGGWAVASDESAPKAVLADAPDSAVRVHTADGLTSAVVGFVGSGLVELGGPGVTTGTGVNPLGKYSVVPWVESSVAVQRGQLCAAAVVLAGDGDHAAAVASVERRDEQEGADVVAVHWATGDIDLVRLDGNPRHTTDA